MSMSLLGSLILGVSFLIAAIFIFLPMAWQEKRGFFEPSSLFVIIMLFMLVVVLTVPHG
jgi:hypothetical protein